MPSQALAWLFLVSAVETAANVWDQTTRSPEEQFRTYKLELSEAMRRFAPNNSDDRPALGSSHRRYSQIRKFRDRVLT